MIINNTVYYGIILIIIKASARSALVLDFEKYLKKRTVLFLIMQCCGQCCRWKQNTKVNSIPMLNLEIRVLMYLLVYVNISVIDYQYDLCGYFHHIFWEFICVFLNFGWQLSRQKKITRFTSYIILMLIWYSRAICTW